MNHKEKRMFVGERINLAGGRFTDHEYDLLIEIIELFEMLIGKSYTEKHSKTGISSDGKYRRDYQYTYSVGEDEDGIFLSEDYSFQDDDGMSGTDYKKINTARELINHFAKIKRIKDNGDNV